MELAGRMLVRLVQLNGKTCMVLVRIGGKEGSGENSKQDTKNSGEP